MSLEIRKATIDDAPALTQAHVRSWRKSHEGYVPAKAVEAFCASRPQRWVEILSREVITTHVALLDGRIVGHFSFGPCRGEDLGERYWQLYSLYLDPDCQRQGIGRQLIAFAEGRAREQGKTAMTLQTFGKNKPARLFYEACGYRRRDRGKVRREYGRPLRVLRYVKEL